MKKIFIAVAFAALAMLAFNNSVKATIPIDFYLHIVDNTGCGINPYTGYYHVTVYFITNGNVECQHEIFDASLSSDSHITWDCNVEWDQYKTHYLRFVICRYRPPFPDYCCDGDTQGPYTIDDLTSGNLTIYETVN